MTTEKSKTRLDVTSGELERVLLEKEGESVKDSGVQGRSPGGVAGKRAIGKAVAKGGLLLKGKNPGNVCFHISGDLSNGLGLSCLGRFRDKRVTSDNACQQLQMLIGRRSLIHRL